MRLPSGLNACSVPAVSSCVFRKAPHCTSSAGARGARVWARSIQLVAGVAPACAHHPNKITDIRRARALNPHQSLPDPTFASSTLTLTLPKTPIPTPTAQWGDGHTHIQFPRPKEYTLGDIGAPLDTR
eukprot:scaffold2872_cov112-Isochrysis_galbana.AAC.7